MKKFPFWVHPEVYKQKNPLTTHVVEPFGFSCLDTWAAARAGAGVDYLLCIYPRFYNQNFFLSKTLQWVTKMKIFIRQGSKYVLILF